jgi:hypothetical protein
VGSGGLGDVSVEEIYVNPATRAISSFTPTIPGSGIMATTFPKSPDSTFPASENTAGNILVETPEGNITTAAAGILQIPLNGNISAAGTVTLTAGTEETGGNVFYLGNIDVSGSGVIGNTVQLKATGNVTGSIVARNNLNITAGHTVSVSAFSLGQISVNADKIDTSELISFGELSIVGDVNDSELQSQNVNTTGGVTGSQVGFSKGTSANTTSQGLAEDLAARILGLAKASTNEEAGGEPGPGGSPQIKQFTGRVTVLPPK